MAVMMQTQTKECNRLSSNFDGVLPALARGPLAVKRSTGETSHP
jgi:hypothetical protein